MRVERASSSATGGQDNQLDSPPTITRHPFPDLNQPTVPKVITPTPPIAFPLPITTTTTPHTHHLPHFQSNFPPSLTILTHHVWQVQHERWQHDVRRRSLPFIRGSPSRICLDTHVSVSSHPLFSPILTCQHPNGRRNDCMVSLLIMPKKGRCNPVEKRSKNATTIEYHLYHYYNHACHPISWCIPHKSKSRASI